MTTTLDKMNEARAAIEAGEAKLQAMHDEQHRHLYPLNQTARERRILEEIDAAQTRLGVERRRLAAEVAAAEAAERTAPTPEQLKGAQIVWLSETVSRGGRAAGRWVELVRVNALTVTVKGAWEGCDQKFPLDRITSWK